MSKFITRDINYHENYQIVTTITTQLQRDNINDIEQITRN